MATHESTTLIFALLLATALVSGCTAPGDSGPGGNVDPKGTSDADPTAGSTKTTIPVDDPKCPGHWHTMLAFFLHDERLPVDHADFYRGGAAHLHRDTGTLIHMHPGTAPQCIAFRAILHWVDMDATNDTWTIGPRHGDANGTYSVQGDDQLHLYVQPWNGTWTRTTLDAYLGEQPGNGARILLTFGKLDDATIQRQQAAVGPIPDNYHP